MEPRTTKLGETDEEAVCQPEWRNGRERIDPFMSVWTWMVRQVKPLAMRPGPRELDPPNTHKGEKRELSLHQVVL